MPTWLLTPNTPHPLTKLAQPVIGWRFAIAAAPLDTITGCNTVFQIGWTTHLTTLADSAPLEPHWQLLLVKGTPPDTMQVVVNETDWFVTDGLNVWTIQDWDAQANYTVTHREDVNAAG